jgi:hypothetical protein
MKNRKQIALIGTVAIIAFGFAFVGCDDGNGNGNDDPKDQSQPITLTFDSVDYSATVTAYLTDGEWNDVANKIKNAINGAYTDADGFEGAMTRARFREVFGEGVTIIVEKTTAYPNYKVVDSGTLNVRFDALGNLRSKIGDALQAMTGEDETLTTG